MKNVLFALLFIILGFTSCKKREGIGGSSTVSGTIMGVNYQKARGEITEIVVTNGLQVEHGDYWLLNSVNSNQYFYIWYNNPTWISNGDPNLAGRTGIPVNFNYTDLNTDIATNTKVAIESATNGIFSVDLINDILIVTNTQEGNVPDADKVTSSFEVNTSQQGRDATTGTNQVIADEKVYITYGENSYYDDVIRTDASGKFQFKWLNKGNYTVSIASEDTVLMASSSIEFAVKILKNKTDIDLGTIDVIK